MMCNVLYVRRNCRHRGIPQGRWNRQVRASSVQKCVIFSGIQRVFHAPHATYTYAHRVTTQITTAALMGTSNSRLAKAAGHGDEAEVRRLIKAGADPAYNDCWALRVAAKHGRDKVVEVLLGDRRVDPAARNSEAMSAAAQRAHCGVLELLFLDGRCDLSCLDRSFRLVEASGRGDAVEVERLIKGGADTMFKHDWALRLALRRGHANVAFGRGYDRRLYYTSHEPRLFIL